MFYFVRASLSDCMKNNVACNDAFITKIYAVFFWFKSKYKGDNSKHITENIVCELFALNNFHFHLVTVNNILKGYLC